MARRHLSVRAEQDLADIWWSTAQRWNTEQADAYIAQISARLDFLTQHPFSGPVREDLEGTYRCLVAGQHLIFYETDGALVFIVRILHGRMDAGRHLPN